MLVYLRDGSAQATVRAATLRKKLQTRLSTSLSHSHSDPTWKKTLCKIWTRTQVCRSEGRPLTTRPTRRSSTQEHTDSPGSTLSAASNSYLKVILQTLRRYGLNSLHTKLLPVFTRDEATPLKQNNETKRRTFEIWFAHKKKKKKKNCELRGRWQRRRHRLCFLLSNLVTKK